MKKLKALVYGACALIIASISTTPLIADVSGPYVGIQASINGLSMDGSSTDSNGEITSGTAGKTAEIAGLEVGWLIPIVDRFAFGLGVNFVHGKARITADAGAGDNDGSTSDVKVEFADHWTAFIQPTFSLTDDTAMFFKAGATHMDMTMTGDVTDPNNSVNGHMIALGSRSLLPNGVFIQFEGGLRSYDEIAVFGGGTNISEGNRITANPDIAYGAFTVGFQF